MTEQGRFSKRYIAIAAFCTLALVAYSTANASDYEWDVDGVIAYEHADLAKLSAQVHQLNGQPFLGFTLYPYETQDECTYAAIGDDEHQRMPYTLDGVIFEAYVFCESYTDDIGHYYTFVTMNDDVQKHIIERFATELGLVELCFDGMIFDLPTVGFNSVYRERTK